MGVSAVVVMGEHIGSPLRLGAVNSNSLRNFVARPSLVERGAVVSVCFTFNLSLFRFHWHVPTFFVRDYRAGRPRPYGGAGKTVPLLEEGRATKLRREFKNTASIHFIVRGYRADTQFCILSC